MSQSSPEETGPSRQQSSPEETGPSRQQSSPEETGHRGYLFAGFASLFAAAFIDNARGPVLPVLCEQLNIPYETAGLFLMLGNIAAVIGTFTLGRLLPRIGERRAAVITCWMAILPGILAPMVEGRLSLLLLGLVLGACVSLVGSISSVLAVRGSPEHARGRYVSMQQVMYGIGSLIAPLFFSALTRASLPWWWLFTGASLVNFFLGCLFLKILPREKIAAVSEDPNQPRFHMSGAAYLMILVFALYVAGEVLTSMWMSSLLVGSQGLKPEDAAQYQMVFFLLMGLTRFLCFLFVRPRWEERVMIGCLILGVIFALLGQRGLSWALPLIGVLGPFFPLAMTRLSVQFPQSWKQMMIFVYVGIQSMLALMHVSVGRVADTLGIDFAFLLAPAFLLLTLGLLIPILRKGVMSKA